VLNAGQRITNLTSTAANVEKYLMIREKKCPIVKLKKVFHPTQ
jgi:hypothetical protein